MCLCRLTRGPTDNKPAEARGAWDVGAFRGHNRLMPAGPAPLPDPAGYTVRAVADRLGIPTATLRSWNRRYSIGPTQHRPGRHRLYSAADIAVLEQMLTLIRAGSSPAGAAAAVSGAARKSAEGGLGGATRGR